MRLSIALACLAFVPSEVGACPGPTRVPELHIDIDPGEVRVNNALGRAGLEALAHKAGRGLDPTNGRPLGLTSIQASIELTANAVSSPIGDGGACVWLDSAEISVGLEELTVHVAKEYRPGTCAYEAVLAHEMTHVQISRQILETYVPKLERAAADALDARPSMRVRGSDAAALDTYVSYLNRRLSPVMLAMKNEQRRANARIDTRESYGALRRRCRDW